MKIRNALFSKRTAGYSEDEVYRYFLRIRWLDNRPLRMFVGLNPSTATELQDDNTVRKCCWFANEWGAGGIIMANAAAFRATDPRAMLKHPDPIGPENTVEYLMNDLASECVGPIVACWGRRARQIKVGGTNRHEQLREGLGPLEVFGLNTDGTPTHPLYLSKNTILKTWKE